MKLIPSGREPFQITVLAAVVLYGLAALVDFNRFATSTLRVFPDPWGRVFIAGFALSAFAALAGMIMGNVSGVLIERIGLWPLAGIGAWYGLWSLGVNGSRALGFAAFLFALAIASICRIWKIRRAKQLSGVAAELVARAPDERTS
ncbi:hypothetical protein UK23_29470 [Lentzea aerocolonigenes]|uniref:Uncharacterized protein n=1 Tax=Lentzea aerocolonigenes TaxID=68170 RepID=A0A0F0GSR3_LENAE|nr:hypothetical protein [Lentzea aerocolonigenes]KJK44433.1 hypothetical protein UK23_29470 [Lentzea aerocolonigenes]